MWIHSSILSLASAVCLCLFAICFAWQKFCKLPPVWLKQLDSLGRPRKRMIPGTAIVCGGSIAGIVAARICADHFERVIIVDPEIEDSEKPKTRILQYNAGHGARRLWPNFDAEMKAAGGKFRFADTQIHYSGVPVLTPYQDYPADQFPDTLIIRRSVGQKVLHRLLQRPSSKLTRLAGTVRSIQPSSDRTSIESVTVRQLDGSLISLQDVALVADCTGTTQAGLKWLNTAGFDLPENIRSHYNGNISYVTICFTVSPEVAVKLRAIIPAAQLKTILLYGYFPHDDALSSTLGLFDTDNNTNSSGRDLPRSAAEVVPFVTAIRGFKIPIPSWVIQVIELLCEHGNPSFDVLKIPTQSFIRYHTLPAGHLPSNFIALGDASLKLNPIHGQVQGIAKAMMNGMGLNHLLHTVKSASAGIPADFSARYFRGSADAMNGLWDGTRLHDYGSPLCEPMVGETKNTGRFLRWFERKLISASIKDEEVASALWHVRHMFAADKVFLAPTILWKVLSTRALF
ncbi:hypothetical protein B0H14DRAFT_2589753 [Mycena olivaceomarginata]|nr:hypothetical protein B0H14DRAFT_2589753 [Mycena olivaceomarginata]